MKRQLIFSILGATVLITVLGVFWYQHSSHIIPFSLRRQITFAVYYPADAKVFTVDKKSFLYDHEVLTFSATSYKNTFTLNEQPEGSGFNNAKYDQALASFDNKDIFDSPLGQVTITVPKRLSDGQVALMRSHGTLVSVISTNKLSKTQWQQFFDNLKVAK